LLEGLEVSELKLSEVNKLNDRFRFDAEFFRKEYLNIENKLQKHNFKRLIDIESRIIHPSEIKREYVEKDGVWFFRTQNIRPLKIEESNNVFISKEDAHSLAKNLIKKGDILITRTGANFGQTALYNIDKIAIGSSHTFILRNEYFKQAYLAVFLNTSFGRKLIDKGMYGGSQPEIAPYYLSNIPIPNFSISFQQTVEKLLMLAEVSIEGSKNKYSKTQKFLLQELGITETLWQTKGVAINNKSFKESFAESGRLDAEYYQPKYDIIQNHLKQFKQIKLKDLVSTPITSGSTPKAGDSQYYTDASDGIPFIRAVDIGNNRVSLDDLNYIRRNVHEGILKKTQLNQNDVLFSIAGTVGRCGIFDHNVEANINQACAILRFNEDVINRLYLVIFFNSEVGQQIIEKYARQGVQTNLNMDEIGNLKIPILTMPTQQKIASFIQQSFQLRQQSKHLLEIAKQAVEIAIETDENTAMEFINANT